MSKLLQRGRPWFAAQERVDLLQAALEERRGTPFREGMGVAGVGYDCWHLLADVIEVTGFDVTPLRSAPAVSLNWGLHHRDSRLLAWLKDDPTARTLLRWIDLADTPVMPGDILPVRQAMSEHHVAISSDEETCWHVPRGAYVSPESIAYLRTRGMIRSGLRLHAPAGPQKRRRQK